MFVFIQWFLETQNYLVVSNVSSSLFPNCQPTHHSQSFTRRGFGATNQTTSQPTNQPKQKQEEVPSLCRRCSHKCTQSLALLQPLGNSRADAAAALYPVFSSKMTDVEIQNHPEFGYPTAQQKVIPIPKKLQTSSSWCISLFPASECSNEKHTHKKKKTLETSETTPKSPRRG